jgi:hypothetical protein
MEFAQKNLDFSINKWKNGKRKKLAFMKIILLGRFQQFRSRMFIITHIINYYATELLTTRIIYGIYYVDEG